MNSINFFVESTVSSLFNTILSMIIGAFVPVLGVLVSIAITGSELYYFIGKLNNLHYTLSIGIPSALASIFVTMSTSGFDTTLILTIAILYCTLYTICDIILKIISPLIDILR